MESRLMSVADWRTSPSQRPPRAAVVLLGGAQLLAFLFLLSFALIPGEDADFSRTFNAGMAALSGAVAVFTVTVVGRVAMWLWDVSLAFSSIVLGFVITNNTDAIGQMLNGTGLVMLALLAALFSTRRRLAGHLTLMITAYLAAVVIHDVLPTVLFAVIATVIVASVGIVTHGLVSQLHRLSHIDPLTGALNRRGLEQQAGAVRSVAARAAQPTAVAIVDLDEFKVFNDTHGHIAGDVLLCSVVNDLHSRLRPHDLVARFGGDEFVVVLPGSTEAEAYSAIHRAALASDHPWTWGLAAWAPDEELWDALDRADRVLYDAKRARTAPHGSDAVPEQRAEAPQSDALAGGVPDARTPDHEHRTADESS